MQTHYWRPIAQSDVLRPEASLPLAGGISWFNQCEQLSRKGRSRLVPISDVPQDVLHELSRPRAAICGLDTSTPRIMGILNVTPDSFSDGGKHHSREAAIGRAKVMERKGADILDIGGESTRPGAEYVSVEQETERTVPVIKALKSNVKTPISIDTRKASVAHDAIRAGATLFNNVSAFSHDANSLPVAVESDVSVCLMHASGDPKTMQNDPSYANVLLDVYDFLKERRDAAVQGGVSPDKIILDPGIGFGKTVDHNLMLLKGLSLFHGLGCPILVGASRKRFIGSLSQTSDVSARVPGSLAVAIEAIRQGAGIIRVHDVAATRQAMTLWHHMHN